MLGSHVKPTARARVLAGGGSGEVSTSAVSAALGARTSAGIGTRAARATRRAHLTEFGRQGPRSQKSSLGHRVI